MKTKLWIIFILVFWLFSCSEENINTIEISKNQEEDLIEVENLEIDEYNFEQLEKVKNILDWLDKNSYSFENLKDFNEEFNQNIKPIQNCYLLSNWNNIFFNKSKDDYIFMFKLYSKYYFKKYKSIYYIYPEYKFNEIKNSLCSSHWWDCGTDMAFWDYLQVISTPCR